MKINFSISPLANVLALVNEKNGTDLDETMVTASVVSTAVGHPGENSEITLTSIAGHGFTGSQTFDYERATIASQNSTPPAKVTVLSTDTDAQVQEKVCAALLVMQSEFLFSSQVAPTEGVDGSITLSSDPSSLLYLDNDVTVVLTL